jgi:transcriptional antiterminator NusG
VSDHPEFTDVDIDVETRAEESSEADEAPVAAPTEAVAPAESDAEVDPVEEFRVALQRAPGAWYVVHSYAGYENRVKANLENRTASLNMEDFIFQIEVPT